MADPNLWAAWDKARLDELLDGMDQFEFLLRFTISHPDLSTTIVGSLYPDHISRNIAAVSKGPLPESLCTEIKNRLENVD